MTDSADISREHLEQLLRFYQESGLDFALRPEPADRFAPQAAAAKSEASATGTGRAPAAGQAPRPTAPRPTAPPPPERPAPQVTVPDGQAVALAEQAAAGAADLDALRAAVTAFEGCNLKRSARHTVFEGGERGADLMLVGGAPSRDDDRNGEAMSGLDGILMGKMLAAIGLDRRTDAYCGFCVPWAVPGGEAPTPLHLKICAPFARRQVALAGPRIVIALGNVAAQQLFAAADPITRLRGRWIEADFGAGPVAVTALFEPAFLREQPHFKRMAWLDLVAIGKRLAAPASAP